MGLGLTRHVSGGVEGTVTWIRGMSAGVRRVAFFSLALDTGTVLVGRAGSGRGPRGRWTRARCSAEGDEDEADCGELGSEKKVLKRDRVELQEEKVPHVEMVSAGEMGECSASSSPYPPSSTSSSSSESSEHTESVLHTESERGRDAGVP